MTGHFRNNFTVEVPKMEDAKEARETDYMTNEEYREELKNIFDNIEDNRLLRYFYIFVSEKLKRVL